MKALIEPVIEDAGFELVDVRLTRGRQPWMLRVTIDTPCGDGLVAVDRCADVSREIEIHLDAADAVSAPYRLEVSSPGLDRVLSREKDFVPACGCEVRIEVRESLDGRRRFRGRLLAFTDGVVTLDLDGREVRIPFDAIAKANTIYEFTRDDFAGRVGIQ
ncbi:MAG: ribosome maturation factor RimP [Myxococcota bacterium]